MGRFFKIFPNLSQNWLKFKKILEESGDFAQNLDQIWPIGIWMGHFFLKNVYLYRSILSNSAAAHTCIVHLYNQTWVPPTRVLRPISHVLKTMHCSCVLCYVLSVPDIYDLVTLVTLRITNINGNINTNVKNLFKTSHAALILNRFFTFVFMFPFMFVIRKVTNYYSYATWSPYCYKRLIKMSIIGEAQSPFFGCKITCKLMGNFAENLNLGKCVLPPWCKWNF